MSGFLHCESGKIGTISARFISCGKMFLFKQLLTSIVNELDNSLEHNFIILGGNLSYPVDFRTFNPCISFCVSLSEHGGQN